MKRRTLDLLSIAGGIALLMLVLLMGIVFMGDVSFARDLVSACT